MPTLVALHAHPDDEAIYTGGLLLQAAAEGWRCVVVMATSGEAGRPAAGEQQVGDVRRSETRAAAKILGVDRIEFLGYQDSGMAGTSPPPGALSCADPVRLAERVQEIVDEECPALVLSYDEGGVYGHPDHVAVHRMGRSIATPGALYEATLDRTTLTELRMQWLRRGMPEEVWPAELDGWMGMDHPDLVRFEVGAAGPQKLAAIAAHHSQVMEADSFMGLPPGVFHQLLGTEWYHEVQRGVGPLPAGLDVGRHRVDCDPLARPGLYGPT